MRKFMKKPITVDLTSHIARIALITLVFILGACNGQKKVIGSQNEGNAPEGNLELLIADAYSGASDDETMVIKSPKALKSFFSQINKTRKPGLPVPDIDFEKEIVVITCSGRRNNGSFPVLRIKEETTSKVVLMTTFETVKDPDNQAITSPFSLYKLPLTDKEIVFEPEQ